MGNTTILRGDQIEGIESSQNFIKNLGERNTAGWVRYNDGGSNPSRPIDGTGGTPTSGLDVTLSATNPLAGDKSFVFSKPASNCQGQGFSYGFAIDRASRAKVLKIEFDYLVDSGTFNAGSNTADSDLIVYIYDVDAGQLIEPSTFKLYANSTNITDRFSGYFQTSATSTNYRLIFHVATTNASAWSLKVDNVVVAPSKYVYGTPITDWTDYPPQLLGSVTNPTVGPDGSVTGKWRKIGDSIEVQATANRGTSGGSNGSGNYYLTLPQGMVADLAKIPRRENVGTGFVLDGGVAQYTGTAFIDSDGVRLSILLDQYGDSIRDNIPSAGWWTSAGVQYFSINATIPIQGWSSSVRMSDGYEGREIVGKFSKNSNQSIPDASFTTLTGFTSIYDTCAAFNPSTGVYTVPVSGYYKITANITFDASGSGGRIVRYVINSTPYRFIQLTNAGTGWHCVASGSTQVYLKAGDTIYIDVYQNSGGSLDVVATGFDFYTEWSIERISSPQTIAMGEVVAFNASRSAGNISINANDSVIIGFNSVGLDTHGAFNTSTSEYTIPVSGIYHVSSYINFDLPAAAGTVVGFYIQTDEGSGFVVRRGAWQVNHTTLNNYRFISVSTVRKFKAGDKIRMLINPSTNILFIGDNTQTSDFSIHKIG